jgi:hypothetical protein
MEHVVGRMLAKSAASRYQNLGVAAHDLAAIQRGDAIPSRTGHSKSVNKDQTLSISRKNLYAALAVITLIAASTIAVVAYNSHRLFAYFYQAYQSERAAVPERPKIEAIPKETIVGFSPTDGRAVESALEHLPTKDELEKKLATVKNGRFKLHSSRLIDNSFAQIANHPSLRYIDLIGTQFPNESLARLAKLPLLEHVNLTYTNFSDSGANSLFQCKSLALVEVNWCDLSDDGVCKLASLPALTKLDIAACRMTDRGLRCIGKANKLTSLSLRSVPGFTNQGLANLTKTHLNYLSLEATPVTDAGMEYVAKLSDLNKVILNTTKVTIAGIKKLCVGKHGMMTVYLTDCPNIKKDDLKILSSTFPHVLFLNEGPEGDDH